MVRAYVALGANLGPRRATLRWATRALDAARGVRVVAASSLFETEPVGGPPGQPKFLNGALALETELSPRDLLSLLQELEARAGRPRLRTAADLPRTLDLDLLVHGDARSSTAELVLPHPRLAQRWFVLAPLAEIAPDLVLADTGRTVREELERLAPEPVR